ncbi:hypothetical protein [Actimicrobium sp. CCI2.3]|uniref:hypothetical protein n=1 Tax=Actimicrobium sp. CCI2.3 TaxID=3048616 RepID=UPI002AB52246|nr:hypothetical protein [Actimicrobium sp. CCI2.3]MDY7575171.1 hypothetical protein [Actimicrobium sp. CCI2.3]MEB0023577.1 hypothetical protein [Actimicrobium sp. CCI2.3]
MYAHVTYTVTTQRLPLAVLDCWMRATKERLEPNLAESTRWIKGYERLADMVAGLSGTRLIYLANREADMLSLMKRVGYLNTPVDRLVHAAHHCCLPDGDK